LKIYERKEGRKEGSLLSCVICYLFIVSLARLLAQFEVCWNFFLFRLSLGLCLERKEEERIKRGGEESTMLCTLGMGS
jgi:hypothetical protein